MIKYQEAKIEILYFESEDVIATSGTFPEPPAPYEPEKPKRGKQ